MVKFKYKCNITGFGKKAAESGQILSNRMYLWKHRGFDPALRKHYWQHFSIFNDMKVSGLFFPLIFTQVVICEG